MTQEGASPEIGGLNVGANPGRNRAYNRRAVLGLLREHGQIGRADLARHLHLTQQAVANIVEELVEEGLVIDIGRVRTKRGQPPRQFALNPEGPVTIGVEIAAGSLMIVVQKLTGEMRDARFRRLRDTHPDAVAQAIREDFASLNVPSDKIVGLGAVMPGPFEIEGMSAEGFATLKGWGGVDAVALLREATGIAQVTIENDATAAAVHESLHGRGREAQDLCYIYFGTGVGLGIMHEGRPMRGAFGNAGEIGQLALPPRNGADPVALESVASVYALRDLVQNDCASLAEVEAFMRLDPATDPRALAFARQAADHLAPVLTLLENIFDPETVILGGGLPPRVLAAVLEALPPLPVTVSTRANRLLPRVQAGGTGPFIAAMGAASMPLLAASSPVVGVSLD